MDMPPHTNIWSVPATSQASCDLVSFLWGARYQTMHELLPLIYILSFSFCESMASLHSAGSPQILKFSCLSIWSVGITYVSWSLHYMMAQISYRGMCSHHLHPGSEPKDKCDQMLLFNSSSWVFCLFVSKMIHRNRPKYIKVRMCAISLSTKWTWVDVYPRQRLKNKALTI